MEKIKVRKAVFSEIEVARLLATNAATLDGEAIDEMQPITILYDENTDEITVEYTAFETDVKPEPFERIKMGDDAELLMFKNRKEAEEYAGIRLTPEIIFKAEHELGGITPDQDWPRGDELKPKPKHPDDIQLTLGEMIHQGLLAEFFWDQSITGNESKCKTCMFKFACPNSTER